MNAWVGPKRDSKSAYRHCLTATDRPKYFSNLFYMIVLTVIVHTKSITVMLQTSKNPEFIVNANIIIVNDMCQRFHDKSEQ